MRKKLCVGDVVQMGNLEYAPYSRWASEPQTCWYFEIVAIVKDGRDRVAIGVKMGGFGVDDHQLMAIPVEYDDPLLNDRYTSALGWFVICKTRRKPRRLVSRETS